MNAPGAPSVGTLLCLALGVLPALHGEASADDAPLEPEVISAPPDPTETSQRGAAPHEPSDTPRPRLGDKPPAPFEAIGKKRYFTLTGTAWIDVIHDINAVGLSPTGGFFNEFIIGQIPIAGEAADRTNRTGFSASQSSLVFEVNAPTPRGDFEFYSKVNLFGSATLPRIQMYKIYGQWGWLFAGLDWTQFLNKKTVPATLDFEGPQAIPEGRFVQLLVEIPLRRSAADRRWFLSLGAEDAPAQLTLPVDAYTRGRVPDFIGKFIYRHGVANIELAGLYRRLGARGGGIDSDINGWGVMLDGVIDVFDNDNVIFGGLAGAALGAYIDDTQGFGLDAAPQSAGSSELKAIPAYGFWLAYQHWWMVALRSTASVGYVYLDNAFDETPNPVGTYQSSVYASINLVWSPWHAIDIGMEYAYGWRRVTEGTAVDGVTRNKNNRLQWTFVFSFQ